MRPVYDLTRMADKRNRLIYPGMQIPEGRSGLIHAGVDIGKILAPSATVEGNYSTSDSEVDL